MYTTTAARSHRFLVCLASCVVACAPQPCAAQPAPAGEQWAVLIAVERHDDRRLDLRYTLEDATQLKRTLLERAGLPPDHVLELTDDSPPPRQPTLANLRRELPPFLAKVGPGDRVLVFFAGHGVLRNGKTYLIPKDADRQRLEETGLPAGEVRDLIAGCRAATKFLVLDCCHAGGTRDLVTRDVPGEVLANALKVGADPGVVVLASCSEREQSYEWVERRQGVFSYWLCRGLEGGADKNGDGALDADEVYAYAHERSTRTVAELFNGKQTPVRIIGGAVAGVPVLLTLRPEAPETLCRRLAEHLDLEILARGLKKVAVLEFLEPLGGVDRLAQANLPAYCAATVRDCLRGLSDGAYEVVDEATLKKAAADLQPKDVGGPGGVGQLSANAGGLDGLVTGTVRRRNQQLVLQCELVRTGDGASLATPSGLLPLSEEVIGDNGASFDNTKRPGGGPYARPVVEHVLDEARKGHPLLRKDFPFKVEVWSVAARPGESITPVTPRTRKEFTVAPGARDDGSGRDLLIAARDGEVFEVRVRNDSGQKVAMSLLIDGLNSLERKRERLGRARSWVLEPGQDYVIEGWSFPGESSVKRFQFVDVNRSVAGRLGYGDSIGLITAAFYAERGRALGVGEGPEERRELRTVGFQAGRLLGVVQIRYADEKLFE